MVFNNYKHYIFFKLSLLLYSPFFFYSYSFKFPYYLVYLLLHFIFYLSNKFSHFIFYLSNKFSLVIFLLHSFRFYLMLINHLYSYSIEGGPSCVHVIYPLVFLSLRFSFTTLAYLDITLLFFVYV